MIVGQSARLALLGVAIGLAGALLLTRLMGSLLYGVVPSDPLIYMGRRRLAIDGGVGGFLRSSSTRHAR